MDLLHSPFMLDAENLPRLRIAFNRIREKLHLAAARLTAKPPAERLVLIGRPGTGRIILSDQIILIEAAEAESQPNRAARAILNFTSKTAHHAAESLKSAPHNEEFQAMHSRKLNSKWMRKFMTSPIYPRSSPQRISGIE